MTYAVSEWEGAAGSPAHYASPHGCTRTLTPAVAGTHFFFTSEGWKPESSYLPGVELNRYRHDWTRTWVGALTNWASQAGLDKAISNICHVWIHTHTETTNKTWNAHRNKSAGYRICLDNNKRSCCTQNCKLRWNFKLSSSSSSTHTNINIIITDIVQHFNNIGHLSLTLQLFVSVDCRWLSKALSLGQQSSFPPYYPSPISTLSPQTQMEIDKSRNADDKLVLIHGTSSTTCTK